MILCNDDCIPCCDFCIHVVHEFGEFDGKMIRLAPIDCSFHKDDEHQNLAKHCGYCDDYHCSNV